VDFLQKTIFKPRKRVAKLISKRNELKQLRLKDKEFLAKNSQQKGRRDKVQDDIWPKDLPVGEKCPVYKCTHILEREVDLEQHFREDHADLVALGLSVGQDAEGKVVGNVTDTLLSQMMVFMLTNKC
jgi:hypothetical protein